MTPGESDVTGNWIVLGMSAADNAKPVYVSTDTCFNKGSCNVPSGSGFNSWFYIDTQDGYSIVFRSVVDLDSMVWTSGFYYMDQVVGRSEW